MEQQTILLGGVFNGTEFDSARYTKRQQVSGLAPIDPSSLEFPRGAAEKATGMYIYVPKDCERRRQQSEKPKCEGYSAICGESLSRVRKIKI